MVLARLSVLALLGTALVAQKLPLEKPKDPYTKGSQAKLIKKAGYVSVNSFMLTPSIRTEKVDEVIGVHKLLWVETPHFKIGSSLKGCKLPEDGDAKKKLFAEIKELRRKIPSIPAKPRKLDRWLRVHLTAHRLEKLYGEFCDVMGYDKKRTDKHLGSPKKFPVLLFEEKSGMQRFYGRFTDLKTGKPSRWYSKKDQMMLTITAADAFEDFLKKDETMHAYLTHNSVHNMIDACHDYSYDLPYWFEDGVAHWFVRQVHEKYNSVDTEQEIGIDYQTAWKWEVRVYKRVKNDYYPSTAEMMDWSYGHKFKYTDHMFMFSRIDFLLQSKKKLGDFIRGMHGLPLSEKGVDPAAVKQRHHETFKEVFGAKPEQFDKAWHRWVLKAYKGKK